MFHVRQITQIGSFHNDHCEDFTVSVSVGENRLLLAALDGCTMGEESFFASALMGKALRRIGRDCYHREYAERQTLSIKRQLHEVIRQLFNTLVRIKSELALGRLELLSTVVLAIVDTKNHQTECLVVGDGAIAVNGELHLFEQDNAPDYLGYHLQKSFEEWYEGQQQRLSLENVKDLSVSTDGVFSFGAFSNEIYPPTTEDQWLHLLLHCNDDFEHEKFYTKTLLKIEREWGLKPTDDLGIVRIKIGSN